MARYNPNTRKIGKAMQLHSITTIQKVMSESEINSPRRRKKANHTVMVHIKISTKKTKKDLSDLGNASNKVEILFRFFFIIASCIFDLFCN